MIKMKMKDLCRLPGNERAYEYIAKLCRQQNGAVAIVVAFSMVALLGFAALVLDLGASYHEAAKLQNALDSAVLAAVRELPAEDLTKPEWGKAKNEAITFASENDIALTSDDLIPVYQNNDTTRKIIGIRARNNISVNYYFAGVLGIDSGTLTRTAAAELAPANGLGGAIPLSITDSSLQNAINNGVVTNLTIKCSSNADEIGIDCTGVSGWFGALRFPDTNSGEYNDLIAYGYSGLLHEGQVLNMENGNMSGPTLDGFTTRYLSCADGCTAVNYKPDCPRLVYVPVVEILPSKQVRIKSFAAFLLEECGGNGNNSYIKASYISKVVLSSTASGSGTEDFGVYVTRLVD